MKAIADGQYGRESRFTDMQNMNPETLARTSEPTGRTGDNGRAVVCHRSRLHGQNMNPETLARTSEAPPGDNRKSTLSATGHAFRLRALLGREF